jgi:nucleotide-binding universal stress UspA family protein
MTNLRTILVPVDFSAESRSAVRHAHDLARVFSSRIHLLHVTSLPTMLPWTADMAGTVRRMQEDDRARARFALSSIVDEERLDPVTTRPIVLAGRPEEVIPRYAREVGAGLIVMGLHAERARARTIGHVADRVMRAVRCPVLAVPERSDEGAVMLESLQAELVS